MLLELMLVGYMGLTPDQLTEYDVHCRTDKDGMMWCMGQVTEGSKCIVIPHTDNERLCQGDTLEEQREKNLIIKRRNEGRKWSA